jgi:hypothetical protein
MPTTYEKIATTTLGSPNTTITFSSIPSTYTDLRLTLVASITTGSDVVNMRFNGDTATNYSNTTLYGTGSAAGSFRKNNDNKIGFNDGTAGISTVIDFYTADIFSYAGSTNKTCLKTTSDDKNGSGGVEVSVSLYRSASAINSVSVFSGTTFATGTTATLYGILKA